MKSKQAKVSVETMKEVQNDKTLRTKGDKDRRLREKKQNNTKRFVDERKNAQMKQMKEKEKLKVRHDKETEALTKDIQSVSLLFFFLLKTRLLVFAFQSIEVYKNEEIEFELSPKLEFYC